MQKKSLFYVALAATLGLSSCSQLGPLSADNFNATPNPMETANGEVATVISGRFPAKYFKKKAVVTVTPVIRYEKGETVGESSTFQGEKVVGNNMVINYKNGGNFTLRNIFPYNDDMQRSELYLTFNARKGKKQQNIPAVKVADGILATSTLVRETAKTANKGVSQDAYQQIIAKKQEASIHYLIQQAKVRASELNSSSVQDFVKMLKEIKADQKGLQLNEIAVAAYASPDGGYKLNNKLAQKREKTSKEFVNSTIKDLDINADVNAKYTAQDWEGFQELVKASNIQDKDVILRVLSMYKDPEEREAQIKNLSAAFQELANEILPELRRARLTINYNIVGRTDAEIEQQFADDAAELSLEEILYCAKLKDNAKAEKEAYRTAARYYQNDYRSLNNLGMIALEEGQIQEAAEYFEQAARINADAAELNANRALLALAQNNVKQAEEYAGKAAGAPNYNEVLGNIAIAKGQYAKAANLLEGVNTNSAALANILTKDYNKASRILSAVANPNAVTEYLQAVVAARLDQPAQAKMHLQKATKDAKLAERAQADLEFAAIR